MVRLTGPLFGSAVLSALALATGALAQSRPTPAQPTAQQAARVAVARETAQVRQLERTGGLRPLKVTASCNGDLKVWGDSKGTPRLVRYTRLIPDNSVRFTGYYDAAGKLRYAQANASGFVGLLYNVNAEYDAQGRRVFEAGTRRAGWNQDLLRMPGLNPDLLKRGICTK